MKMPNGKTGDFLILARSILSSGGIVSFPAKGFSMRPAIVDGDVLKIAHAVHSKLRRGAIIFYENDEGEAVVHRLMEKTEELLMTKGDSMAASDSPIHVGRLLGRVVAIERNGRRIDLESFRLRLVGAIRFHPLFRKLCRFKRSRTSS